MEKRAFVEISKIRDFKDHPFKVVDDEKMEKLVESVRENGIITPVVVRQVGSDYEMISGHRRKRAAEIVGLKEIPCVVKELNDDEATILMVQSNIQRETILPSEKAFAYKMELEAMNHQGKKISLEENKTSTQIVSKLRTNEKLGNEVGESRETILPSEKAFAYKMELEAMNHQGKKISLEENKTSTQIVSKLRTNEKLGNEVGESRETIRRYIRLTYLIPELLKYVDTKRVAFNSAVEISYMQKESQQNLFNLLQSNSKYRITLAIAKELKELEKQNNRALTENEIEIKFGKENKKEKIGDRFELNVIQPAFTQTIAIECRSRRPDDPCGWICGTFRKVEELGWNISDLLLSLFDYINNEHKIPDGLIYPRAVEEKKEEVKVNKPELSTLKKPIYELDLTECRDCLNEIKSKRELNNDKMLFWVEEHKIAERVNDLQRDDMSMYFGDEDYWA